jgi:hypothetical protein
LSFANFTFKFKLFVYAREFVVSAIFASFRAKRGESSIYLLSWKFKRWHTPLLGSIWNQRRLELSALQHPFPIVYRAALSQSSQ